MQSHVLVTIKHIHTKEIRTLNIDNDNNLKNDIIECTHMSVSGTDLCWTPDTPLIRSVGAPKFYCRDIVSKVNFIF